MEHQRADFLGVVAKVTLIYSLSCAQKRSRWKLSCQSDPASGGTAQPKCWGACSAWGDPVCRQNSGSCGSAGLRSRCKYEMRPRECSNSSLVGEKGETEQGEVNAAAY